MYYSKLDGLRCIAVFMVLLAHFPPYAGEKIYSGLFGVILFFVLSGFLITNILLGAPDKPFLKLYSTFIGRRALRIFPIYYLVIALLFVSNFWLVKEYIFYFVTYTYNYAFGKYNLPITIVHPFWTLCIEEQYYLFWPFIVLLFRKNNTTLLVITGVIIGCSFGITSYRFFTHLPINGASLTTHMFSLAIGSWGAIISARKKLPELVFTNGKVFYLIATGLALILVFHNYIPWPIRNFILSVISLFIILKACFYDFGNFKIDSFLTNKYVQYLGSISYGIYIYHEFVSNAIEKYFFTPIWVNIDFSFFPLLRWHSWIFKFPLHFAATIVVASLSFRYIEKPLLSLKEKMRY